MGVNSIQISPFPVPIIINLLSHIQMVDRLDGGVIAADLGPLDYMGLYKVVLFQAFFVQWCW